MKIELPNMIIHLNDAREVVCVRCAITGKFVKKALGVAALEVLKTKQSVSMQASKAQALEIMLNFSAMLVPFLIGLVAYMLTENALASGLFGMLGAAFLSTTLTLVANMYSNAKFKLQAELRSLKTA